MGFTTKEKETERKTHHWRKDVLNDMEEFRKAQGWDKSDVPNRAVMYYLHKWKKGELDDPMVDDDIESGIEESEESRGIRDIFR